MDANILYLCIGVILILLFGDYRQTLDIKNHTTMYEINPILGRHPSDSKITVYFIVCAILFTLGALRFTIPGLYVWIGGWAVMELWAVQNNIKLGLKF